MTNKNISILALVVLLGGLSLYLNRDWFAVEVIQVSHRSISPRAWMTRGPAAKAPANPIIFLFNKNLRLTAVKVVVVSDAETNKYPHAIWNLSPIPIPSRSRNSFTAPPSKASNWPSRGSEPTRFNPEQTTASSLKPVRRRPPTISCR